jgi:hypothetical protein
MGRIITPTYRAEYQDQSGWHAIDWNTRGGTNVMSHGKPTDSNAELRRRKLNESFTHRGCNHHVSVAAGYLIYVRHLRIIHQASGMQVATTHAPYFEIV